MQAVYFSYSQLSPEKYREENSKEKKSRKHICL